MACCTSQTVEIEIEETNEDNSQWMTNLPVSLTTKPLNQLAIPGSHDSGAYYLDPSLPLSPGKLNFMYNLQEKSKYFFQK